MTPSLFTLQRARQRHAIYNKKGDTHRLDDPYTPADKYMPPEKVIVKGLANHDSPFTNWYRQKRSLSQTKFEPSIVTSKGGNHTQEGWFTPTINKPKKKKKDDDEQSDNSDNSVVRAYKKQQAHVEALYWHEGDAGRSADRECACVYGETRHYKRPKKIRYFSARRNKQSKEIWARLTRPKSAAVIRKRD